ncbi:MAG TPA: CoA transferase [Candidatus Polarisedimenticolia bacterium]|nr:CoA transferase [Candidatus Polarisedimenticolia bacterium]
MSGPLAGVRILDLGHDWACPHAARLLADFGAEVIKVEYPRRLDGMRGGRKEDKAYNRHPRFHQLHRNKLSLALDLKAPGRREAFLDLVRVSDVVIDNSRPGVMDRLGIGYSALQGARPDIILVSMTAFGHDGPESAYAGYGGTLEALSGIQSLTAYDKHEAPRRIREMDVTNGIMGACAVMTALVARTRTGQGAWIDLSELESASQGLIGEHLLEHLVNGATTLPLGNRHASWAPHGCYRCDGADRWIVIAVTNDGQWKSLCEVLGRGDLAADPRFRSAEDRMRNHDELDALIEQWTGARSDVDAMGALQKAGIPAGVVMDASMLAADPHLAARGFFQTAADGSGRFPGFPFRLSGGGGQVRWRGPDLAQHNESILCDLLGRPRADVAPLDEASIGTAFEVE